MVAGKDSREVARIIGLFNAIGYTDNETANSAAVAIRRLHNADQFGAAATGLIYIDWILDGPQNGQELISLIRSDYKIKLMAIVLAVDVNHVVNARGVCAGLLDGWVLKPPTRESLAAALAPIEPRMIPPFNV
jgi:hypothetical protein